MPYIHRIRLFLLLLAIPALAYAQVQPAGTRLADVQVGGSFNFASADYGSNTLYGFGAYATADFKHHLGVELSFHQLWDPGSSAAIYERTYEVGPRYVFYMGRFKPYLKALGGRGVFQFPPDPLHPQAGPLANLAYTIWSGGVGTDFKLTPALNLRADYEFQRWPGFPPNGLSPRVFSLGVAYHFH